MNDDLLAALNGRNVLRKTNSKCIVEKVSVVQQQRAAADALLSCDKPDAVVELSSWKLANGANPKAYVPLNRLVQRYVCIQQRLMIVKIIFISCKN